MRALRWVVSIALVAAIPGRAHAWNPLKAAADGLSAAGRAIGGFLGAPAGGFVDALSAPTIHNVEDSSNRIIHTADDAIGREIQRAGSVTSGIVAQTNTDLAARLDQVDRSLAARIVQVKTGVDDTVDRAFGRLDRSLGRLDDIARRRIAQVEKAAHGVIDHLDATVTKTIAEADDVLARRTDDLRALVNGAIQQADQAVTAAIAQLDDLAGRRLGNLDVIATKQELGLEAMLLRLAALIGMVAFIAFIFWRLFAEAGQAWRASVAEPRTGKRVARTVASSGPRFLIQLAMGGVGIGVLYLLAGWLPRDAQTRAQQQIADHEAAFDAAVKAYDFAAASYHESQLEILAPADTDHYRGLAAKAQLLRSVLTRPARLESLDGIKDVMAEVADVEARIGADDPDVLVVKAYVTWQVGSTRADEHEAAALCAQALGHGDFPLAPMARNYLRAFLHDPYTGAPDVAHLRAVLDAAGPERAELAAFQHIIEYDRLVAELDHASSVAYLELLSAHADLRVARAAQDKLKKGQPDGEPARAARARRTEAAGRVVEAWRTFDAALESSPWLADDPTSLAAFTLDDAVLSRALYFTVRPDALDLAPELMSNDPLATPAVRVEMAPLRVAWERRYAPLVGARGRDVLAYQEAQRFKAFEQRDHAFEQAYVAFLIASRSGKADLATAVDAAERCAAVGLYRDTPAGPVRATDEILAGFTPPPDALTAIDAAYQMRRLRFL